MKRKNIINNYYTEEDFSRVLDKNQNKWIANRGKYKEAIGEGTHFNTSALRKLRVMAAHTITYIDMKDRMPDDTITEKTLFIVTYGDPDSSSRVGFYTKDGGKRSKFPTFPLEAIPYILEDDGYYITSDALATLNKYISIANKNKAKSMPQNPKPAMISNIKSLKIGAEKANDLLVYCAECFNQLMSFIGCEYEEVSWAGGYFYGTDGGAYYPYHTIADFVREVKSLFDFRTDQWQSGDCYDVNETKKEANACKRFLDVFEPYINVEEKQAEIMVEVINKTTDLIVEKKYGARAVIEESSKGDIPVRKTPIEVPEQLVNAGKKVKIPLKENEKFKNHIFCQYIDDLKSLKDADEKIYNNTMISVYWSNVRHKYIVLYGNGEKEEYTEAEFLRQLRFSDTYVNAN